MLLTKAIQKTFISRRMLFIFGTHHIFAGEIFLTGMQPYA